MPSDWVTGNRCGRLNTGVTKEGVADNYKGEDLTWKEICIVSQNVNLMSLSERFHLKVKDQRVQQH